MVFAVSKVVSISLFVLDTDGLDQLHMASNTDGSSVCRERKLTIRLAWL